MRIILANPRGFCAGVKRAIDTVTFVLQQVGAPVYVYHEVVHNRFVVDSLKAKGAIFVDSLDEVPEPATLIFSAHGVSEAIKETALSKRWRLFDATCPLVHKVHQEVRRWYQLGYQIVMIGHKNHVEVIGTMGQVPDRVYLVEKPEDVLTLQLEDRPIGYVMQTTLSMDEASSIVAALRKRYPDIAGPVRDDICYATQNRQQIIKSMAADCDIILVVGSKNSSNSNRLREVAEGQGVRAYLIDDASQLNINWFKESDCVGISAGASAPEILVEGVIVRLQDHFDISIDEAEGVTENLLFAIPKEIVRSA